jgi:1,4-dihydroxy-2-naphthoate octaprenyltransferase
MAVVSDNKKCQTLINAGAIRIQTIRTLINELKAIRTLFNAANPSVVGTALQGNLTALSNSINALDTEANIAVWTTIINAYVPTHEAKALD